MTAPIFLAVFFGLVLARVVCWAFIWTIWLPLTHRRDTEQDPRGQDIVSKSEQWLHWAALKIPDASDPRYFKATVRLSVAALEYRRSLGEALDRHFDEADMDEAPALESQGGEISPALDQSTREVLYEHAAILYNDEAACRNRLSAAIDAGVDAACHRRDLSRTHRATLEEYASGAWRPSQDDPGPVLVTAVRALITAVDAIQEPR